MNNDGKNKIHIVIILGSVRENNFTKKAARVTLDELEKTAGVSVELIDPSKLTLPLPGQRSESDDASNMVESIKNATGVILSTPEYHGSFSSVIKLVIENLGFPSVLSGKPVSLLGVAGGQIGAIKSLEALRGVCSHVGAIVLPGPVSIANVQNMFDENGKCTDESTEKRLRGLAENLVAFIKNNICPGIALEAMVRRSETASVN